jgi:hypothetical protein
MTSMCFPAILKIITKKLNMRHDVEWLDVVHFELNMEAGGKRKEVGGVSARLSLVRLLKSHHDGGDSWRRIRDQGSRMFEMRPLLS